ncbi:hypothetical protein C8R46DRAFT_1108360 [Mycena filopes]|nr:hypothetical protein C8R46DRAFT_1108360 [Mycena filopes]
MHAPHGPHAIAAAGLGTEIAVAGARIDRGFTSALRARGQSVFASGATSKEPDWAAYPSTRASKCPSIVIESAVSESMAQLERDARLWLTGFGNDEVLTVIGVKVWQGTTTLGVWKRDGRGVPRSVSSGEYGLDEPVPDMVLHPQDLFLPLEMPSWMAGQVLRITGGSLEAWITAILA